MMLVKTVILTTALLCASSVHALEVTGMNDVKSIDSGMSARLAAIVAVINDLKTKFICQSLKPADAGFSVIDAKCRSATPTRNPFALAAV